WPIEHRHNIRSPTLGCRITVIRRQPPCGYRLSAFGYRPPSTPDLPADGRWPMADGRRVAPLIPAPTLAPVHAALKAALTPCGPSLPCPSAAGRSLPRRRGGTAVSHARPALRPR